MADVEDGVRFVQDYVIEKGLIGYNCLNARMKFEDSLKWIEVSVIKCNNLKEAEEQKARSLAIGSIMARPIAIAKNSNPHEDGYLLFIERLYRLEEEERMWKFENGKSIKDEDPRNMWKIVNKVCVGFSNYYRRIFQQIALGILTMHSLDYCYGNPCFGVLYGADGKVRLYDMNVTVVGTTLREDFYSFKRLLHRFIRLMPLPDKVVSSKSEGLHVPHGVKCYFDLISNIKGSNMDYYKWLYNPPIFWNANQKGLFIGIMSRIMREFCGHSDQCFKFKEIDNDWGTKRITQGVDPKLWNVYHYTDKAGRKNKNYQKDWGSTVYARNFLQHCKLGTTTFDLLEPVLPELISLIYKHLVEGITRGVYYGVMISDDDDDDDSDSDTEISLEAGKVITSAKDPPSDDDDDDDDEDVDDGTKVAPTPKFISIDQFLWKSPRSLDCMMFSGSEPVKMVKDGLSIPILFL